MADRSAASVAGELSGIPLTCASSLQGGGGSSPHKALHGSNFIQQMSTLNLTPRFLEVPISFGTLAIPYIHAGMRVTDSATRCLVCVCVFVGMRVR